MRIAFVTTEVPNTEHSTATHSAFLMLQAFRDAGHTVSTVLLLPEHSRISDETTRQRWLRDLRELGANVCLLKGDPPPKKYLLRGAGRLDQLRSLVWPQIVDYFPHTALCDEMSVALSEIRPDVILIWFSYEGIAATHGLKIAPRFAFIGDPVHLPGLLRQYPPFVKNGFPFSPSFMLYRMRATQMSRMMTRLLSQCDSVAAVAAHHTKWFRRSGVPHCKYMSILIPDWGGLGWQKKRKQYSPNGRLKIVMMGHVGGTATLAGLYLLANETLPLLEQSLGRSFEIHICGKDQLPADLVTKLNRPSVRLRGFVDDVITELLTCDVFMVPTPIPLGVRGRIPYAWSCGCCVVSHQANTLGLPEMIHEENALIAADGRGLAQTVIRAYKDPALRTRIGISGRRTYETQFSYSRTSNAIIAELERLVATRKYYCL